MQRLLAALVLSIIGFLPIAPAFGNVNGTATLPACCRAQGKHKCVMASPQQAVQIGIRSQCDQCPFAPGVTSTPIASSVFLPASSQVFFAGLLSQLVAQAQTEARYRISFARSRQKRGPPSFLS